MNQVSAVQGKNGSQEKNNGIARDVQYARHTSVPAVDILENADEVLIVADIPGFGAESVDIRVEHDTLTLSTKRVAPGESAAPALAREYAELEFARSFRIPGGIDTANVTAEAKAGTVVVRLPKAAAAKARKIAVTSS